MKNLKVFFLIMWLFATMSVSIAQSVDYLTARPLSEVVTTKIQPVKNPNKIPMITWGGDLHTILAFQEGIFASQGLSSIELFKEDNFKQQVEMCLRGEIPAIRGTLAMINAAAEIFQQQGTDLVVVYAMTTSDGGDWIVWREGKNLNNISTVGAQLYGPHMDLVANLFTSNNRIDEVQFKWLANLSVSDRVGGKIVDPVTALQVDKSLDAAMCIAPDALMLTSGGVLGDGSDNSVKGANGLSTKTANKIIYDVYAFRKDYFDANKAKVESFVKSLFLAEEMLQDLSKNPQNPKFVSMISKGASYFQLDKDEVQDLLLDCSFLGYNGNVAFFTGTGTTRNFATLNSEISKALRTLGILKTSPKMLHANWDYTRLATGLKKATAAPQAERRFDQARAAALVEQSRSLESKSWQEDETILFYLEIYFEPDKPEFNWRDYISDFDLAIRITETYGGSLVAIQGHTDHGGINKAEARGASPQELAQIKQQLRNLGLERSKKAQKAFFDYCKQKGIKLDESRFVITSNGGENPKYKVPRTSEQWAENFRVVFVVRQIETSKFDPSAY